MPNSWLGQCVDGSVHAVAVSGNYSRQKRRRQKRRQSPKTATIIRRLYSRLKRRLAEFSDCRQQLGENSRRAFGDYSCQGGQGFYTVNVWHSECDEPDCGKRGKLLLHDR